jgi:SNF2 family DNA or RNA helicase
MNTKRTKAILNFKNKINCKDILTLSGTPIKAHPKEMIPMLKLIDPLFDDDALEIFNSINTGRTTEELESIIKNRFGLIMRREVKSQIATELPEKIRKTIKIKIPNGEKYTLKNIKILYDDFCKERR